MSRSVIPCVGAVVFDTQGRLLMIQRGHDPGAGLWSIPGGRIEPGETDEQALVRELVEETNLHVSVGKFVGRVQREGLGGGLGPAGYGPGSRSRPGRRAGQEVAAPNGSAIAGTAWVGAITQRSPPGNLRLAGVTRHFLPIAQGCPDTLLSRRDRIVSKVIRNGKTGR